MKKILFSKNYKITSLILVFLLLFYFGVNQTLIFLGKGYIFQFRGYPILVLGVANYVPPQDRAPYTPRVVAAFDKILEGNNHYYMRPKYEHEAKILKIDGNTIEAEDLDSGDPVRYVWTKDSAYGCMERAQVRMGKELIDTSTDPKGMKFIFFGLG